MKKYCRGCQITFSHRSLTRWRNFFSQAKVFGWAKSRAKKAILIMYLYLWGQRFSFRCEEKSWSHWHGCWYRCLSMRILQNMINIYHILRQQNISFAHGNTIWGVKNIAFRCGFIYFCKQIRKFIFQIFCWIHLLKETLC